MSLLLLYSPLAFADPFVEWKGLPEDYFGISYGIAVGDANGDGYTDLIAPYAKALWLNEAAKTWTFVEIPEFGEHFSQYGASFGDYNADGLPDIGTEPRGDDSLLLRNDGGGEFTSLDTDHFPIAPLGKGGWGGQQSETNAWVDADSDGFLDLFVPAYYGASGFYQNLGPDGTGEHVFEEMAVDIGIVLSPTSSLRPEGAQFVDIDRDGDPDLYVCGELLRNVSTPGNPRFENDQGGIPDQGFDEGAAFADVDMDGDIDLGVMYNGIYWTSSLGTYGFLVWENLGDGTFRMLDPETAEDWSLSGPRRRVRDVVRRLGPRRRPGRHDGGALRREPVARDGRARLHPDRYRRGQRLRAPRLVRLGLRRRPRHRSRRVGRSSALLRERALRQGRRDGSPVPPRAARRRTRR